MLYDSSTTQVLPYSTSLIPPMTRRSTPPAVLGASKPTVALTPSKASYTANLSLPCPFSLCVPSPSQVYHVYTEDPQVRPLVLSCLTSPCHPSPRLRTQDPCTPPPFFYCLLRTAMSTAKILFVHQDAYSYAKTTISTPEPIMPTSLYLQPRGFRDIRLPCFYHLSLRLTLAVSTPVVSFRSTPYSVFIV